MPHKMIPRGLQDLPVPHNAAMLIHPPTCCPLPRALAVSSLPQHCLRNVARWLASSLAPVAAMLSLVPFSGLITSCSSQLPVANNLPSRYFSVQSALAGSGMLQRGGVSRGQLGQGQTKSWPLQMAGECVTVVAMGGEGAKDLDLVVQDDKGKVVAQERETGPDAAVRFCADHPGKHSVKLTMKAGAGAYALSVWSGGADSASRRAGRGAGPVEGGGSCDAPTVLEPGRIYVGDTTQGESQEQGSCGSGQGAELVYQLDISQPSHVIADLSGSFDTVLYIRKGECSDPNAEVECNDDSPGGPRRSRIETDLQPGTYFVIVDGYSEESGRFRLSVRTSPIKVSLHPCQSPSSLALNASVSGRLGPGPGMMRSVCASDHADGPEQAFVMNISQRSRVRLSETAVGLKPSLHVHDSCGINAKLSVCASSAANNKATMIRTFEPGAYVVVADSSGGRSGRFTLHAEAERADGRSVPGDTCSSALTLDQDAAEVSGDTFYARDDVPTGGLEAPDIFYRLDVKREATLDASFAWAEQPLLLALMSTCDHPNGILDKGRNISAVLRPGTYWIAVDGGQSDSMGRFRVAYRFRDHGEARRKCRSAPALQSGHEVTAVLDHATDSIATRCMGRPSKQTGGEHVYRFSLAKRSRVRVALRAAPGAGLALRVGKQPCLPAGSSTSAPDLCHRLNKKGIVRTTGTFDAGTYYVVVDGGTNDTPQRYRLLALW